ncbi:MAG: hypothetical protein WC633_08025 [Desulfurivibrionaceae bacterium]|jgi:hypothetical protein
MAAQPCFLLRRKRRCAKSSPRKQRSRTPLPSSLREQTETLALQIRLIEEQWHSLTDREQFSKTLFTLQANAPINMENHLQQMSQLADRSVNGFTLNTVSLAGEVPFPELYRYLQYIEGRPEIGIIEDLAVERLKSASYDQQAKVKFSMVVGRTTLDKP